ncbi:MAG: riboflavin synthase [Desulfonatronovibrio sp. MSAO_Bac4]|nr:MAG: riboflavin synthase [Desulfonatronovibrio sp. MSAO_Bac4]
MFTGLIQTIGKINGLEPKGSETRLRIALVNPFSNLSHGESIAVNGVCLTVEDFGKNWFYAYASSQTMHVTNLKHLKQGDTVNLERALSLGDRLGGHLVSGHVDCQAEITAVEKAGESVIYTLTYPESFSRQVISKGSIALDGISLTVIDCGNGFLKVNIIPATQKETTINSWTTGSLINMETDVIGKYVERMLGPMLESTEENKSGSRINSDFLKEHGFFSV